ncbi:hypothetical protein [Roseimicrobium sp. ORNL1]|uniref:hypothetical protein n=1 Tax=Roseimicrobium sp. ORNL1 TaxID=2711231 RepID=UPI0013E1FB00|nr:hypothetical protein [Roseimicrobium sp. ORNL1]QIF03113.1 hypothetical protein G5S37_16825 [Roseimicrobium sp. ORNL1]
MRFRCLLFLFGLVSAASAAEIKVPVVGLGWQISFQGPVLQHADNDYAGGSFQFRGNAGRFNISIFVEPPPEGAKVATNAACRDFYWAQASRNPVIVADSIKKTTHATCEAVTYRSKGTLQGTPFVQDSVNCFFVHEGRWVDVHASIISPTEEETKWLSQFAPYLTHGPWKAAKGEPEKFVLEGMGTLTFSPPTGWLTGNVLKQDVGEGSNMFTVSFRSPVDPNSSCLMTLSTPPRVPAGREAIIQAVEGATQRLWSTSVEGKAVCQELNLKQGMGAIAAFTDASLVGKPMEPGHSKVMLTGLMVPNPKTILVMTIFTDEPNGDDAKAMLQALETVVLE